MDTAHYLSYRPNPSPLKRTIEKAHLSHLGIVLPTATISTPDDSKTNSEFSKGLSNYQSFVDEQVVQPLVSAKTYFCSESTNQDRIEFRTKGTRFKYFKKYLYESINRDGSLKESHKINHGIFVRIDTRKFPQRNSEFYADVEKAKLLYHKHFAKNRNNKIKSVVMQKAKSTFAYNEYRN